MNEYEDRAKELLQEAASTRSKRKKALLLSEAQVYATLATLPRETVIRQGVEVVKIPEPTIILILAYDMRTGNRYRERLLGEGYKNSDIVIATNSNPDQIRGIRAKEVHAYEHHRLLDSLIDNAKLTVRGHESTWINVG